jgi:hypothetical protein
VRSFISLVIASAGIVLAGSSNGPYYDLAQTYINAGLYDRAEQLAERALATSAASASQSQTTAINNAKLFALLADALAHRPGGKSSDLLKAEAYSAWSIHTWPCATEYWRSYVEIRLRRQILSPVRVTAYRIPASSWTVEPPVSDTLWARVNYEGFVNRDRAIGLLQAENGTLSRCTSAGYQSTAYEPLKSVTPVGSRPTVASAQPIRQSPNSVALPSIQLATPSPVYSPPPPSEASYFPLSRQPISKKIDHDLDEARTAMDRADFRDARKKIMIVDRREWSSDHAFAAFLLGLVMLDGEFAHEALLIVAQLDSTRARELQSLEAQAVVDGLLATRSGAQKQRIGTLLSRIAVTYPDNSFARSAAVAFDGKIMKKDSMVLAATLEESRFAREQSRFERDAAAATEARFSEVECQLQGLNAQAIELIGSVGTVRRDLNTLDARVTLTQRNVEALAIKVATAVAQIKAHQGELRQLIEQRDVRTINLLNSLRSEVVILQDAVRVQGERPIPQYPALLAGGFLPPPAIVRDVIMVGEAAHDQMTVGRMLGYLSNAASIGWKMGRAQINALGIISALADLVAL